MPKTLTSIGSMAGDVSRRSVLRGAAGLGSTMLAGAGLGFGIEPGWAQDELKLGWIRPTTGRLASSFAEFYIGGLIAIDEINNSGGILGRRLVRAEVDDEGSPAKEPAVLRKLKDAGVSFVCGPVGSSQSLSALATTTPSKMIHASYALAADVADGTKFPYHYQFTFNTDLQSELMVKFATGDLGSKKIGILRENTAFGEQGAAATTRFLSQLGLAPTTTEVFALTAPSLDSYVANLQKAGTEVVVAWMANIPNVSMAFAAMNAMKWYPPIVGHTGLFSDAVFDLVPHEVLNNVFLTYYKNFTWKGEETPSGRWLDYARKISTYPEAKAYECNVAIGPFYDFLYALKHVAEGENTLDPVRIKRAMDNLKDFDGMLGRISFTEANHAGISIDQMVMAKMGSGRHPKANGPFRERV